MSREKRVKLSDIVCIFGAKTMQRIMRPMTTMAKEVDASWKCAGVRMKMGSLDFNLIIIIIYGKFVYFIGSVLSKKHWWLLWSLRLSRKYLTNNIIIKR